MLSRDFDHVVIRLELSLKSVRHPLVPFRYFTSSSLPFASVAALTFLGGLAVSERTQESAGRAKAHTLPSRKVPEGCWRLLRAEPCDRTYSISSCSDINCSMLTSPHGGLAPAALRRCVASRSDPTIPYPRLLSAASGSPSYVTYRLCVMYASGVPG
jgi:hypothetical protein